LAYYINIFLKKTSRLTNAIAIYFPNNRRMEISFAVIDLHCKKIVRIYGLKQEGG